MLTDVLIGSLDATTLGVMSVAWHKVWSSGTRAGQLNSLFYCTSDFMFYTRRLKPVIVSRFCKAIPDPEASNLLNVQYISILYLFNLFKNFMIEYNSVLQSKTQSLQGFKDPGLWRQTSKSQNEMGQKWTHGLPCFASAMTLYPPTDLTSCDWPSQRPKNKEKTIEVLCILSRMKIREH